MSRFIFFSYVGICRRPVYGLDFVKQIGSCSLMQVYVVLSTFPSSSFDCYAGVCVFAAVNGKNSVGKYRICDVEVIGLMLARAKWSY